MIITIDEAIANERKIVEKYKTEYELECARYGKRTVESCEKLECIKVAEEHEQLANWLEELKAYKQNTDICPICDTYCSYLADEFENGYNKAIDDCKEITFREVVYCDSLNDRTEFRELAEQLKETVKRKGE